MASISYEYRLFEFARNPLTPLTQEEYTAMQHGFESFCHRQIEKAEAEFKKMKNPHAFKWKMFWVLLGCGALALGLDYGLKAMGYEDAGEAFAMVSFIPLFAVVIQPIQWLLSSAKSSSFSSYGQKARRYFQFHYSLANGTRSYSEYGSALVKCSAGDFEEFVWQENRKLKNGR